MTCRALTEAGAPCRAHALVGRPYCSLHDPERRTIMEEARRRGGETTKARRKEVLPDFSDLPTPCTLADVAAWQARVSEALVRGELDPRRGRELTYNLRSLKETLQATEQGAKADRLLEAVAALKAAAKADK